ncbi:MAG: hypothetical protein ABI310_08100, partial [Microbacteriaceae bacterium]
MLPAGLVDAAQLNAALAVAPGDFVVLVDPGATLAPEALETVADALRRFPNTDLLYGDSVDAEGTAVLQRPLFSPIRLRGQDYLGGARVFR